MENVANPIGQIFLRLLFMLVIPLVVSALILGVAELGDVRRLGKIGLKTFIYTVVVSHGEEPPKSLPYAPVGTSSQE